MKPIRSKHRFWPHEYCIAVTKGHRTRYFYGAKLKDALAAAKKVLKRGDVFSYARFHRGKVTVAEVADTDRGGVRSYLSAC